jgi:hypothetical protein
MAKALRALQFFLLIAHSFGVEVIQPYPADPGDRQIVPNNARTITITRINPSPPLG